MAQEKITTIVLNYQKSPKLLKLTVCPLWSSSYLFPWHRSPRSTLYNPHNTTHTSMNPTTIHLSFIYEKLTKQLKKKKQKKTPHHRGTVEIDSRRLRLYAAAATRRLETTKSQQRCSVQSVKGQEGFAFRVQESAG